MSDLSIAVLIGRLTRDAELKYTNSGQAICHMSLATNTKRNKGGQWVDEPSFWEVDLWGKQGEALNQYLTKGKQVAVDGTMRQDRWDQDGQQRMKVVINANSVQLLGGRSAEDSPDRTQTTQADYNTGRTPERQPQPRKPAAPATQRAPAQQVYDENDFSDDIPF